MAQTTLLSAGVISPQTNINNNNISAVFIGQVPKSEENKMIKLFKPN